MANATPRTLGKPEVEAFLSSFGGETRCVCQHSKPGPCRSAVFVSAGSGTGMGMDVLRCQSPDMVTKEILMHCIVYNVLRLTIHDAAQQQGIDPRTISFKASLQAVRHWEPQLSRTGLTTAQTRLLMDQLREAIAASVLHQRLGRTEPRCVKRRPKPYALLTEHRQTFREIAHRGRYRAKAA
jgi:hypothetical protein